MTLSPYTLYAGFWRRLFATLLDQILFGSITALLFCLIFGPEYFYWLISPHNEVFYSPLEGVIDTALPFILTVYFWVKLKATPGKLLMGCIVVNAKTGQPLTTARAALRYLCYLVSALPLCLGFLWVIWDPKRQGFHDKIADSVVIMEEQASKALSVLAKQIK